MKQESSSSPPVLSLEEFLTKRKSEVEECLDRLLPEAGTPPGRIHEAMRYSVFAGGKRIRPVLALATAEALEAEREPVMFLASSLEMIHTYSLIHDDLPAMDDDDLRRGRPTAHRQFGEALAILAGNALFTLAVRVLTQIPSCPAPLKLRIIERICRASGTEEGMLAGQVLDLESEGRSFTEEEIRRIHSFKTGALIEASVHCAALLAGASQEAREQLDRYARHLGLAFQIVDDILDVEGSSEVLGKRAGRDDLLGKATYPALHGLEASRQRARELVEQATQALDFLGSRGAMLRELAHFISTRRF